MQTKKFLYAAVGAQVSVAKSAQAKLDDLFGRFNESATNASKEFRTRIDGWAGEGEEFLGKVTDSAGIDDLTARVDFDQVQNQVHKLRDQLEDIVSTWRSNFRPESKQAEKIEVEHIAPAAPATEGAAAKKPAASKPAASKPATSKPATSKPAASKPAAKKPAAKKPAPRKPATKATSPTAKKEDTSKAS